MCVSNPLIEQKQVIEKGGIENGICPPGCYSHEDEMMFRFFILLYVNVPEHGGEFLDRGGCPIGNTVQFVPLGVLSIHLPFWRELCR